MNMNMLCISYSKTHTSLDIHILLQTLFISLFPFITQLLKRTVYLYYLHFLPFCLPTNTLLFGQKWSCQASLSIISMLPIKWSLLCPHLTQPSSSIQCNWPPFSFKCSTFLASGKAHSPNFPSIFLSIPISFVDSSFTSYPTHVPG